MAEGEVSITGKLTSNDLDHHDTATFSISENAGTPAGFELLEDGSYRFDPTHPEYDHLNVGDTEALLIPVTVTDKQGATDTTEIRITVTGTNDAPVADAEVFSAQAIEGGSIITGEVTSKDVDDDSTALFSISEGEEKPAGFELLEDGSYRFDPTHEAYEHLYAGEVQTITIPVTITDDNGATDTSEIRITLTGTNDAPVAEAEVVREVAEGDVSITGKLTSDDLDHHDTATFTISENAEAPAGFELLEDGTYRFDPTHPDYDHLNVGDTEALLIPVTVTDEYGATDTTQITVTVTGTNDAPVATLEAVAVDEGDAVITGQLEISDLDDDSTATFIISEEGRTPAGFTLNPDGSYIFDPSDNAYEHLKAGALEVLTIPVTVTDDNGATDTTEIKITITGTNDAPVAGAEVVKTIDEGKAAITGQLTSSDLDDDATATFTISEGSEAPAGFTLNPNGSYSFDSGDSAYEHMTTGDQKVLTIPVTVTDDFGATDTTGIKITVTGTNDAPVADFKHIVLYEGTAAITGQMGSSDIDDGSVVGYSISSGFDAPAGFELSADGSYRFDPGHEEYDHLHSGDTEELLISVTVTDEQGMTDTTLIQITLRGTNDAPVTEVAFTRSVDEGAESITGQLTSSDLDDGATVTYSISEGVVIPAGLELNSNGYYSFDPSQKEYDHLNVGDTEIITVPVDVTDDNGATRITQLQITVTGTNDAPDAGVDVSEAATEGGSSIVGLLTSTDIDDNSTAIYSLDESFDAPAGFELNANGIYSFNPGHSAYDHLNIGETLPLTIPVTVTDDNGATDTLQIQITVTGTNDAPVANISVASVFEGDATITGQLVSTDLDDDTAALFTISEGNDAPAGFILDADGSYRFDSGVDAYDHLNIGDEEVLTVPVTVTDQHGDSSSTQIQITVMGTNDAPVAGVEVSRDVLEGAAGITGQLTSDDLDDGASALYSISAGSDAPAGFVLKQDGSYSFDPSDAAYEYLPAGGTQIISVPITVTDEHGASDTTQVQITVTGTNDAPVAHLESVDVYEGAALLKGQLSSHDLDDDATAVYSISEGGETPQGFELNEDGSYTFDPGLQIFDHLNVGDTEIVTILSPSQTTMG